MQQAEWMCGEDPPIRKIKGKLREELPNGFTACRETDSKEQPVDEWAAAYIARPEVYTTPSGKRFIAICGYAVNKWAIGGCEVAYGLMRELALSYEVSPCCGQMPVPIDELIDFDRGLRAFLHDMRVNNYIWPTP